MHPPPAKPYVQEPTLARRALAFGEALVRYAAGWIDDRRYIEKHRRFIEEVDSAGELDGCLKRSTSHASSLTRSISRRSRRPSSCEGCWSVSDWPVSISTAKPGHPRFPNCDAEPATAGASAADGSTAKRGMTAIAIFARMQSYWITCGWKQARSRVPELRPGRQQKAIQRAAGRR